MRNRGKSPTFVVLFVAVLVASATPLAAQGIGSAELELLGPKSSWSAIDRKIDPGLLLAARATAAAQTKGGAPVATTPGIEAFIARNVAADQSTFVVIKGTVTDGLLAALAGVGAREVSPFPQYGTVTARVPITSVTALAAQPDVRQIGPREGYQLNRHELSPEQLRARLKDFPGVVTNAGSVNWQGVVAHQADKAQQSGFDGTGVKVCVLADGVDSLAARQASGDLPATVQVLAGQAGSGDEGTAMLEIVHDMAPGAALAFATVEPSQAQFAANILALRNTLACDIIVDGAAYVTEGVFQDDDIAVAVNAVSTAGALYFSAAGNTGNLTHGATGTFEGDFAASGNAIPTAITVLLGPAVEAQAFGANNYTTLTAATNEVALKWGDSLHASANNYDLVVMDATSTAILGSSTNPQSGAGDEPYELASCSVCPFPVGARIYVVKGTGNIRALHLDTLGGTISNGTTGGTRGHNAASGAITVAAVDLASAGGGAFTGGGANPVQAYSADGPRRMFLNPNGTAITPGNIYFFLNGGVLLPKVDVAAGDCGSTATPAFTPFCGTSAAATAAAAVGALVKSAKPAATAAEIKAALLASALDIEAAGSDRDSGAGIVMAPSSVRGVLVALTVTKTFVPASIAVNGTSQLSIVIGNSNAVALQGVAFTDTYPSPNVKNAIVPAEGITGTGCAGTLTAAPGGGSFALTAGVVPANTTCTFFVAVTATAGGVYVDNTGAVTTPIGLDTPAASATLTVTGAGATAVLVSAAARKTHGLAGVFDLPLTLLTTNPSTEPRLGPVHSVVLTFDRTLLSASLGIAEGTATGCSTAIAGADLTITCTNVTNIQYVTYALTNIASTDGGTGGSATVRVGYLAGDVNGNRVVTVADLALVNAVLTQFATLANYRRDINASGVLTVADKAFANANLTRILPPP